MIEIPEAIVVANQLKKVIVGKKIVNVTVNSSPHKFAWFHEDPNDYPDLLINKRILDIIAHGSRVDIIAEDSIIDLCEGVNIRYIDNSKKIPKKHQLLIEFSDSTYLSCSIQMYGGLLVFEKGTYDNPYYIVSKEKPTPIGKEFTYNYFLNIYKESKETISVKAFLATEQRIPGLGNGCLQDILFTAGLHPKRKINTLGTKELKLLYKSIISVLQKMIEFGGRDTEKTIYGDKGNYKVIMSRNTVNKECPACGTIIKKANYMGGSVYFCETCQPL